MPLDYAKISLTAKLTAYMRQFAGVPFAADVAEIVHARGAFERLLLGQGIKVDDLLWYAPILEARYRSIAEMVRRCGVRQVLELASGLTLRGLAMTADLALRYVETDLPEIERERLLLVNEVSRRHGLPPRDNLRTVAANALSRDELALAAEHLRPLEPVAIIHEGLLQYLTATETERVALNIHELLGKFGGVWITPDFSLRADAAHVSPQQRQFREIVAAATERALYNNAFDNSEHLNAYFGRLGFQVEVFNQLYLAPELTSAHHLRPGQLEELQPRLRLWMLSRREGIQ